MLALKKPVPSRVWIGLVLFFVSFGIYAATLARTVGFIDSENMVKASKHRDVFEQFINTAEQAPWIARNFITNGRPLFNEKAYKVLVDQGHKDRADRYRYNEAEAVIGATTLKGPGTSTEKSIQLFNEVFGA